MSSHDSLSKISITVEPANNGTNFHWRRRIMQFMFIAIAIIVPVSGLLRVDLVTGAFVVLDRQIWWADFFLIFGLWLLLASGMVMLYSTVGTAFCGWACPQNTLSEIANDWTYRLLGKRADMSVAGEKMKVASAKDRWYNWLLLGTILVAMSMLLALIPLLYFYPPDVIWSFMTFRDDERLADSLHYIYFICMLVVLVDVSFIRHFWCRFMCVYRVWQHGFKTHQTLKLAYDDARSESCEKCNFCSTVCFIGLDPTNTDMYDSCINCGECIDACNTLQAKKGETGLLSFTTESTKKDSKLRNLAGMSERMRWTLPFSALGLGLFVWGIISYDYYHLSVYRVDQQYGTVIRDYRIAVSNKLYSNAELKISIEGMDEKDYVLSQKVVQFDSAGRIDLVVHMNSTIPPGLHTFLVHVNAMDGWHDAYRVQHFVEKNS
ncbi:MAG: 4Fe-4S binding protein [Ectothiorhodospiraceae bacterium]|nr:4Fe-4S binding protein [Ectothiorhodospiraceae bacterium]